MKHTVKNTCPGLFYATAALDGDICRIRTPGGIVTSKQFQAIANVAQTLGDGYAQITNRANCQIRGIHREPLFEVITELQQLGLASGIPEVDHLRNIMGSPTAGIDRQQLIDTRPFITQLDEYISSHAALAGLPHKFSIGVDGGEGVSILSHNNEIIFRAVLWEGEVYFRVGLSLVKQQPPLDVKVLLRPEECYPMAIALIQAYGEYSTQEGGKKRRLRQIIEEWGMEAYLARVDYIFHHPEDPLQSPFKEGGAYTQKAPLSQRGSPWGVYPQKNSDFSYVGLAVPLGRLKAQHLKDLAGLAEVYGSGVLRLTPWQNLLISDIPNQKIPEFLREVETLGWQYSSKHLNSTVIACAGSKGCGSSVTDTQTDALALIEALEGKINKDKGINIHITGCAKSCAMQRMADITLLGNELDTYDIYVGKETAEGFGELVYSKVPLSMIPSLLMELKL